MDFQITIKKTLFFFHQSYFMWRKTMIRLFEMIFHLYIEQIHSIHIMEIVDLITLKKTKNQKVIISEIRVSSFKDFS